MHRRILKFAWEVGRARAAWFAALVLVACGVQSQSSDDEFGTSVHAILGGEPSGAEEDGVVQIVGGTGLRMDCSATLIAPDVIVTALHCVAEFSSGDFACDSDGNLQTAPPNGVLGATFAPEEIEIRVGSQVGEEPTAYAKKVFRSGAKDICKQDIAVIVLDRELDLPLSTVRLSRGTLRGERMRAVGYGINSNEVAGRFSRSGLRVTDVGADMNGKEQGNAAPYTFVLTEGPCQGDSGGPAFSEETGAIVGVYSISGGADCAALGIRNIYTTLAPFEDLVLEAFEYAGREPLLEVGGEDADAGGDADEPDQPSDDDEDGGSGSRRESSCGFSASGSVPTSYGAIAIAGMLAGLASYRLRRAARRT